MENKIRFKLKGEGFTWYDISCPKDKDFDFLSKNFDFHHLDLEDLKSDIQRAKIDEYPDYLFVIINVPVFAKQKLTKSQIYFFISGEYIITIHENNSLINNLKKGLKRDTEKKEEYFSHGSGYLFYMILDDLFESAFPLIDKIEKQISHLEDEVFKTTKGYDRLKDILKLKKDIINFRRIIMPERSIIALLEHKTKRFLDRNLELYFDDVVDKVEKIWNHLENLHELIETVHETNDALISHNTNHIIKILTIVSVILMPLTFITGFYGMNIQGLPVAANPFATIFISIFLFLVALSMVIYFKHKKWI